MKVDVQVEAAAVALYERDRPGLRIWVSTGTRRPSEVQAKRRRQSTMDSRAERLIVGESVAQRIRQAEHPLADGNVGQFNIHDVPGECRHAAAAAGRTQPAGLARQEDEVVRSARLALARPCPESVPEARSFSTRTYHDEVATPPLRVGGRHAK